jgi:hypothetical protein
LTAANRVKLNRAQLSLDRFRNMRVVSALVGERDGLVFLAPWDEPDLCVSLHIVDLNLKRSPRISRVDVISFQGAYQHRQLRGNP